LITADQQKGGERTPTNGGAYFGAIQTEKVNQMFPAQVAKKVEEIIYDNLVGESFMSLVPERIEVKTVVLYDTVQTLVGERAVVTAGFFNKIVSDMKRAGVIGTARGGDVAFLSQHSFDRELLKRRGAR
jgi:hypothetical protein